MNTREKILTDAQKIVCKDRDRQYGSPEDSFTQIAELWNAYLYPGQTPSLKAEDVGMMMILLKVARESNKHKEDNLIDIAGYAACVAETKVKLNVAPPLNPAPDNYDLGA